MKNLQIYNTYKKDIDVEICFLICQINARTAEYYTF